MLFCTQCPHQCDIVQCHLIANLYIDIHPAGLHAHDHVDLIPCNRPRVPIVNYKNHYLVLINHGNFLFNELVVTFSSEKCPIPHKQLFFSNFFLSMIKRCRGVR